MKTILITGAKGSIGTFLRETLRGKYRLRLSDIAAIEPVRPGEEFRLADIRDPAAVESLVAGVDGVVHLGAVSREDAWQPILETNFQGAYNVFEAARRCGVKRVIFASSNHAVGFYRRNRRIGVDVPVRPDSRYGVSKAFGEALGSLYADKYGLEVLCIRIGNVAERPVDVRRLSIWISPRDLTQLVEIGLEHPQLRYEIVYGMSDNARAWWDNANAARLGYRPLDRAEEFAEEILRAAPPVDADSLAEQVQGGDFAVVEAGGGAPQRFD